MFEAEIRGKKEEESILLSRAFGTLKIVNKDVLKFLLKDFGIDISAEELKSATFRFWKKYAEDDARIPDVIIETSNCLLFVEGKLDSPVSADQLRDEYKDGIKHKDNFYLLCITPERKEPSEIREVRSLPDIQAERIIWTSWVSLRERLSEVISTSKLDGVSEELVKELIGLLEAKGFVRFAGFERDNLFRIVESQEAFRSFFGRISILIEELSTKLEEHGIINKRTGRAYLLRDGTRRHLNEPERWVHTFCAFAFADRNWDLGEFFFGYSTYLFIRFYLDRKDDPIWVGYGIGPWVYQEKEWVGLGLSDDQKKNVCEYLKLKPDIFVACTHQHTQSKTDFVEAATSIKPEHLKYNKERRLEFFYKAPLDCIDKPELVDYLVEKLVSLRDMVNEVNMLPMERVEEETEEPEETEA